MSSPPQRRSRPRLFRRFLQLMILIVMIGFCTTAYARKVEPNWLNVVQVPLTLPHLAPEFEGYRIVQLSDIHADRWMTPERLSEIVDRVNQQQPDLVALTGDYVTKKPETYAPTLAIAFQNLQPTDRTVAVLGNHDAWTNPELIAETLERAGVMVLDNQVTTVERKGAQLQIAGVGDVLAQKADLDRVLADIPASGAAILLAHEPDFADTSATTGRFDLQLSGHSHGGQVLLPFTKPILPTLGVKYAFGQYQVGEMIQYTNRGVGMTGYHMRFNARPEITVFTLHHA